MATAKQVEPKKSKAEKGMDDFMAAFEKDFGTGKLLGGNDIPYGIDVVSTGSMVVDYKVGIGGFPVGRCTELWGMPGSCKTTHSLLAIAEMQRMWPDRYAAFLDVENSFDRAWAEAHGVNVDKLRLFRGLRTAEEVSDIAYRVAGQEMFGITVLDSIGAMIPKEEFEKMADEVTVGTTAKIITRMVKKLAPTIVASHQSFVFINQMRALIGGQGGATTGGGYGLKHVSSLQLKYADTGTKRMISVGGKQEPYAKEIAIKAVKNKMAPPEQNARPLFIQRVTNKTPHVGIDLPGEVLTLGKDTGVIERRGATLLLPNGEKFGSGDKALEFLEATPACVAELRLAILETVKDSTHNDLPTRAEFDEDQAALDAVAVDPEASEHVATLDAAEA